MFQYPTILRAPEPDPAGGGSGEPKPIFSDEQLAAIGQTVNAAVTSHLKRQPTLADQLKAVDWKAMLAPVVTELVPKVEPDPDPKAKKPVADDATARQLKDLADKLEASEKRSIALEQARVDAEQQRAMDGAQHALRSALQPKVRGELLDLLVRDLTTQKALKLGENNAPILGVKRAPYKGAPEQDEDLPLSEAIPIWLASEGAKVFLPAPGTETPTRKGPPAPRQAPAGGAGGQLPTDPAARTLAQFEAQGIDLNELIE